MMKILFKIRMPRFFLAAFLSLSTGVNSGCVTATKAQYDFQIAYSQGLYSKASQILGDNPLVYGKQNSLLFWLDKAMACHLAKDYQNSFIAFTQAKKTYDRLFTRSITNIGATFLVNDYLAPYRGRDYERVMINDFCALNFLAQGKIDQALIEARNFDYVLKSISQKYPQKKPRVFKDDGFSHLLFGIAYESFESNQGNDDSRIEYDKAKKLYQQGYYQLPVPDFLKDPGQNLKEKAVVYLVYYNGIIPEMAQDIIPVPLADGYIVSVAFPKYLPLDLKVSQISFSANKEKKSWQALGQVVQDIDAIAREFLDNERVWYISKSVISAGLKYLAQAQTGKIIKDKWGKGGQIGFEVIASAYNLATGVIDLRQWQSLPAKIYMSRLVLDPGEYEFFVTEKNKEGITTTISLGKSAISQGQTKFLISKSAN